MRYITPEHCIRNRLGEHPAPSWPAALVVFRDHTASQRVLAALDDVRPLPYRVLYNRNHPELEPTVFEASVAGQTIVVVTRAVWGGPQAAILVEELACLGVSVLIGYGIAGSIDPALPQGTLVVAQAAVPADGTSRAYGAASMQKADAALVETAIASAAETGSNMKSAVAAAVDALYRETDALVGNLREQGAQIINMETSPFYAASAVCGVKALWVGHISDCLPTPLPP